MDEYKAEASIKTLEAPSREDGSIKAKIDNKDISHQMRIESEASYNSNQDTMSRAKQFSINKGS